MISSLWGELITKIKESCFPGPFYGDKAAINCYKLHTVLESLNYSELSTSQLTGGSGQVLLKWPSRLAGRHTEHFSRHALKGEWRASDTS